MTETRWTTGACILCAINCGLEIGTEGRRITKVRGDRSHPTSKGYVCEKATRLDYYQNGKDRLTSPLRRRDDGTFEEVDWDTAIAGVARDLAAVRDAHGGEAIFHYGGGAQGNHLVGAYGRATRAVLGSRYTSNALAQEKTGEFWVDGQLYGRARCHTCPDFEHAEVAVFVGKNPWQSHGFPRARAVLREIANDPARTLIVIDPRRSETADLADIHLRVKPAADAYLLIALLRTLLDESLADDVWLAEHAVGLPDLRAELAPFDVEQCCLRSGISREQVRQVAQILGGAGSVSILEDLGIQQGRHSTLCSWLEKLLYLLTGNFGVRGGMNIHSRFAGLGGGRGARRGGSPVGGHRIIGGLIPANVIPDEILTDHPDRFRAMIVESSNPAHSVADSARMREALSALDCVVVIDVAMTETARLAHWVLPAASQYEKWECTFFNLEFPENVFQLRPPVFDPLPGTLPEAEIHARLVRELGGFEGLPIDELRAAAKDGLEAYGMAFFRAGSNPEVMKLAPALLYETMEAALPSGARSTAAVWGLALNCAMTEPDAVRRAGFDGPSPIHQGTALFEAILAHPEGVVFTVDELDATWRRLATDDKKVRLVVPELLDELRGLRCEQERAPAEWPLLLSAGERRSSTANTLYRDPAWRHRDDGGALCVSPEDALALGLSDGGRARITTQGGSAVALVQISDRMQPGHVSLPNGQGLSYPDEEGVSVLTGIPANELTRTEDRDWVAGTPWHKHVPARIEAVPS